MANWTIILKAIGTNFEIKLARTGVKKILDHIGTKIAASI